MDILRYLSWYLYGYVCNPLPCQNCFSQLWDSSNNNNSHHIWYLWSTYSMPGTVLLSAFHSMCHLVLTTTWCGRHYCNFQVSTAVGKRSSGDLNSSIQALEPCTSCLLTWLPLSPLVLLFWASHPTFRRLFPDLLKKKSKYFAFLISLLRRPNKKVH